MHFSTVIFPALALLQSANALMKGFNIQATRSSDKQCKTQADWTSDFKRMQAINPGSGRLRFTQARVFASSDCNTLANAVPAAIATNTKILVGVWTQDATHFHNEKQALLAAAKKYGVGWISAISVGSEDLYRKETSGTTLANQIYDVRGMMTTVPGGSGIKVGHVDTWTAWVDGANAVVIKACDFIGFDGYPYWEGAHISSGYDTFVKSLNKVKAAVATHKPNTPIWITETGWPVAGDAFGAAIASVANAANYYQKVACPIFRQYDTFYYSLHDYEVKPSFGVLGANGNPMYSLTCAA